MFRILLTLAILMTVHPVKAHVPFFSSEKKPLVTLPQPLERSIAIYSSFDKAGDLDLYQFTLTSKDFQEGKTIAGLDTRTHVKGKHPLISEGPMGLRGRRLFVGTVIPGCKTYQNLLPSIAIVGPRNSGLAVQMANEATKVLDEQIPFTYDPESEEVYIFTNQEIGQGKRWYEKYTRKNYFQNQERSLSLTLPGLYKIYIWNSNEHVGDYVLAIGDIEVWGLAEIMQASKNIFWLWSHGEIKSRQCRKELSTNK